MRMLVLTLLTFKKVKLNFGHPVCIQETCCLVFNRYKDTVLCSRIMLRCFQPPSSLVKLILPDGWLSSFIVRVFNLSRQVEVTYYASNRKVRQLLITM